MKKIILVLFFFIFTIKVSYANTYSTEPQMFITELVNDALGKLSDKNFTVTVLRQGTVYGYSPKMRFDLVINRMTYEAWKNKRILLMKDGTQRRPTLHIKDAIRAMRFILERESHVVNNQIFNVGHEGNNLKMIDIAKLIKKTFKTNLKIEWYGSKDHRSYYVDFSKIKSIGFKGKFQPINGIQEILTKLDNNIIDLERNTITLDWYKELEDWNSFLDKIKIKNKLIKL